MTRIFNSWWWRNTWYDLVVTRFNPRNRWATKQIPRTWSDVDYIFEKILFAGLIFYWEQDAGEKTLRYQWESIDQKGGDLEEWELDRLNSYREVYNELKAAYEWAKVRDQKYDDLGVNWKLEEEYQAIDDAHLSTIIKYRKYMWS